jgi:Z1 domain
MNNINHAAKSICYAFLNLIPKESISSDSILKIINEKIATSKEFETVDKSELFEILMAELSIGKGEITSLSDNIEPWLYNEKANIKFDLWDRYKLYMHDKDPSFPVNELDDFTDKILDKCVNPKQNGSWDRRGMVVGHVQSGKTSNYVGVINKAVDAGYKLVIVIAGTISTLRRQTHERIDEGFIGRSSAVFIRENKKTNIVGVGKIKVGTEIYSLTSSFYSKGDEGDFNQKVANSLNIPIGKNPVVFVIKKNKSILENLIDWLSKDSNIRLIDGQPKLFDVPALIIDDEADAASVNTAKTIDEAKAINKLIRVLLNLFNQNTFIGYTATPYANLFIPQESNEEIQAIVKNKTYKTGNDLFPKDFIINIKAPQNYIGAAKIFGLENPITGKNNEPLDIFRSVNDFAQSPFYVLADEVDTEDFPRYRSPKKDEPLPEFLPESLKAAIKSFILTCAIRRVRRQETKHNSMLVHVALLVKWIDRVAYLVNEQLREYTNAINGNDSELISEFKELYLTDFEPTTENILENLDYKDIRIKKHEWEDILLELPKAVTKIEVRSVHGTRSISNLEYHNIEEIDYGRYENGFSVIAVGGSRLSRGITLEGLSISYYLRTTKMYDSLMQMGRWFGYRPGYVDLCRIYTTEEIFSWFNHVTMATEEMRNDFDEMTALLKRPKDFRLKVQNHSGLLTITSLSKINKNYTEQIELSLQGKNPQTYLLLKNKSAIENNFKLLENLFNQLGYPKEENLIKSKTRNLPRYLIYRNVDVDIVCDFVGGFKIDIPSINNEVLVGYIKNQEKCKSIKEWSICIVSNTDDEVSLYTQIQGKKPDKSSKTNDNKPFNFSLTAGNETIKLRSSVRNQTEEHSLFKITKNQIDDLKDRQVDLNTTELPNNKAIKSRRKELQKGLLLIYALDPRGTSNADFGKPIIGYSLHFPEIENEMKISYTVTKKGDFLDDIMEDDDQIDSE